MVMEAHVYNHVYCNIQCYPSNITAPPLACSCLIAIVTLCCCEALPPVCECAGGAVQGAELQPCTAAELFGFLCIATHSS